MACALVVAAPRCAFAPVLHARPLGVTGVRQCSLPPPRRSVWSFVVESVVEYARLCAETRPGASRLLLATVLPDASRLTALHDITAAPLSAVLAPLGAVADGRDDAADDTKAARFAEATVWTLAARVCQALPTTPAAAATTAVVRLLFVVPIAPGALARGPWAEEDLARQADFAVRSTLAEAGRRGRCETLVLRVAPGSCEPSLLPAPPRASRISPGTAATLHPTRLPTFLASLAAAHCRLEGVQLAAVPVRLRAGAQRALRTVRLWCAGEHVARSALPPLPPPLAAVPPLVDVVGSDDLATNNAGAEVTEDEEEEGEEEEEEEVEEAAGAAADATAPDRAVALRWRSVDRATFPELLPCSCVHRVAPRSLSGRAAGALMRHVLSGKPVVCVHEPRADAPAGPLPSTSPLPLSHMLLAHAGAVWLHCLAGPLGDGASGGTSDLAVPATDVRARDFADAVVRPHVLRSGRPRSSCIPLPEGGEAPASLVRCTRHFPALRSETLLFAGALCADARRLLDPVVAMLWREDDATAPEEATCAALLGRFARACAENEARLFPELAAHFSRRERTYRRLVTELEQFAEALATTPAQLRLLAAIRALAVQTTQRGGSSTGGRTLPPPPLPLPPPPPPPSEVPLPPPASGGLVVADREAKRRRVAFDALLAPPVAPQSLYAQHWRREAARCEACAALDPFGCVVPYTLYGDVPAAAAALREG